MSHSRIALLTVLLVAAISVVSNGQDSCSPVQIVATSNADTIFVTHMNAYTNCCIELEVEVGVEDNVVNFYEADVGPPCDCICCFNLRFDANGFAAGRHIVRVWTGTHLIGETEVEVEGTGGVPVIGLVSSGACLGDPGGQQPQQSSITWGKVKTIYR